MFFFFFKQKTAYEMRISDWSSDVCSSDLQSAAVDNAMQQAVEVIRRRIDEMGTREPTIIRQGQNRIVVQVPGLQDPAALKALLGKTARLDSSEERRVGKECVSTCRSWW